MILLIFLSLISTSKLLHNYFNVLLIKGTSINVTVLTDPPGPIYSVASWIRFKCIYSDTILAPVVYEW